jgi:hypothetical protein
MCNARLLSQLIHPPSGRAAVAPSSSTQYDKGVAPGVLFDKPTKVSFEVGIFVFGEFNEFEMSWSFNGYTTAAWQDDRLNFAAHPEVSKGLTSRITRNDCPGVRCPVWSGFGVRADVGETMIQNVRRFPSHLAQTLYLRPSGAVKLEMFGEFMLFLGVPPSLAMFPFDNHKLRFTIEALTQPTIDGKTGKNMLNLDFIGIETKLFNPDGLKNILYLIR